jgi:hypothetical protein
VKGIIRLTMPLAAGAKLDGYEVIGLPGAGGMGEVYRSSDPALKREVANLAVDMIQDPDAAGDLGDGQDETILGKRKTYPDNGVGDHLAGVVE